MNRITKFILSLVIGIAFSCSFSNLATAADYWIWGNSGYNYYVVTEQSSLLDSWSAKARMKEVAPNGKVYAYDLYMWEMKGVLWSSNRRADLGTKNGRPTYSHDGLVGRTYDYMMHNYQLP